MTTYTPPIEDMRFVMTELAGLDEVAGLPGCEAVEPDLVDAVLEEAGKLASGVLAPLNRVGDTQGSRLENGVVVTPDGFKEAYATFAESGWHGLVLDPEYGGQGLPWLVATPVNEMWHAANMAFGLCPMLTVGAAELLSAHGSSEQKALYMPKFASGEWCGTMDLTEPQAGSDLGAVRTRAERHGDHYRLSGQKIYITYGDHDLAENIIHFALARTPDAPPGTRGISLFIVPKFLIGPDGSLGRRNDLRCVSLEHKLGIHASPTAVLAYGDDDGAVGYLVGEENRGLNYMFTMMNNERLAVGLQGVGVSERAYQQALAYARERVQGRVVGDGGDRAAIIHHPDVRRMLMTMKSQTEAMRALSYYTAALIDGAERHPDEAERQRQQAAVDFLTPVVKAWSTDLGLEIASHGIQIHGGMGYVEETGAAQHLRDVRIAQIYEGTNGIQAADLVGRKLARDSGAAARAFIDTMRASDADLAAAPGEDAAALRVALGDGITALARATDWIVETQPRDAAATAAVASPYLRLLGTVAAGWLMARAGIAVQRHLAEGRGDPAFCRGKLVTARFYAEHVLPQAEGLATSVVRGAGSVVGMDEAAF